VNELSERASIRERSDGSVRNTFVIIVAVLTVLFSLGVVWWFGVKYGSSNSNTTSTLTFGTSYPAGIVDSSEPSGVAPPSPTALAGYRLTYETNFTGTSLPSGWNLFTGIPGGDPGGQFAADHVVVGDGLLSLNTWKDRAYQDRWVTGGLCQCGFSQTYGAYFVRSRITGAGANQAELLWPLTNTWPPEIDFNENGGRVDTTSSTVHFGSTNHIDQRHLLINMTLWHTWGVVWTPASITYVVDGYQWSSVAVPAEIPAQPMTLDIEQRQLCELGRECPTVPQSMQVDWVAEYAPK
jgi:hypothetical protein